MGIHVHGGSIQGTRTDADIPLYSEGVLRIPLSHVFGVLTYAFECIPSHLGAL